MGGGGNMCLTKNNKTPGILFILSLIPLAITAYIVLGKVDKGVFGIAGTQWIEVSILLAVYAVYAGTCCDKRDTSGGQ